MAQQRAGRTRNPELSRIRQTQEELQQALQLLFDLLEQYSPSWYTQEHRNAAQAALRT